MQQEIANKFETEIAHSPIQTTKTESPSPINFPLSSLSALSAALLAACSGGDEPGSSPDRKTGSDNAFQANNRSLSSVSPPNGNDQSINTDSMPPPVISVGFNNFSRAENANQAVRFLLQSQLNANDEEINILSNVAFYVYLQQQFAKPIGQTGWEWLEARGYGVSDTNTYFLNAYPAEFMVWNQLFTAQDSMRKRVALGLSEFFVASMQSAEFDWRSHAYAQYWDILVKNAFGNFRQLLEDVTLSPAMGYYLNTKGNQKENPATGRLPDENYAREVMQLFTIGLHLLNLNGTVKLDANGAKIESYTQSDVTNIARIFTGYDFDARDNERIIPVGATYYIAGKQFTSRPMSLTASKHSALAASFLGTTIPANTPGAAALKTALDTLFNHPNVGPFFGRQMIQRFVTSNPSPDYVARVATAFNNNGSGVRGDLKAVWTAIFLDDEARDSSRISNLNSGKLREPMLRFIQWGRTFGLGPVDPTYQFWKLPDTSSASNSLGQSPLRSPSVFNFFRPGFIPPSSALAATNMTAPEFQLVNETTVGGYLNFMQDIIRNGFRSYRSPSVPQDSYPPGQDYLLHTSATYLLEIVLTANATALVKRVNLLMAAGQVSVANQTLMINAISSMPVNSAVSATLLGQKMDRVAAAILMVMASSGYLIQK